MLEMSNAAIHLRSHLNTEDSFHERVIILYDFINFFIQRCN